jgi:hypothetical protein
MEGVGKMRMQIAAALCSAVMCSTVLAWHASSSSAVAQKRADRQTHSTIKDLMDSIIDPSADVIWGAVGSVVDEEGVHERRPKTPEEWLDVRRAAVRLIEGGNLLTVPGRAVAPAGTRSEHPGIELEPDQIAALIRKHRTKFDAHARALRSLGFEALRAIDARNADQLIDIGGRIQGICESCHKTFWYPFDRIPPRN